MALRNILLATAAILASTAAFAGDHAVGKGGTTPAVATSDAKPSPKHHGKHHAKKEVKKEETTKEETAK